MTHLLTNPYLFYPCVLALLFVWLFLIEDFLALFHHNRIAMDVIDALWGRTRALCRCLMRRR